MSDIVKRLDSFDWWSYEPGMAIYAEAALRRATKAEIERLRAINAQLLEALKEVERWFIYEQASDRLWPPFAKVLAAIAKAEGKP